MYVANFSNIISGRWILDAGHWTRKCLYIKHLDRFKTSFIYTELLIINNDSFATYIFF